MDYKKSRLWRARCAVYAQKKSRRSPAINRVGSSKGHCCCGWKKHGRYFESDKSQVRHEDAAVGSLHEELKAGQEKTGVFVDDPTSRIVRRHPELATADIYVDFASGKSASGRAKFQHMIEEYRRHKLDRNGESVIVQNPKNRGNLRGKPLLIRDFGPWMGDFCVEGIKCPSENTVFGRFARLRSYLQRRLLGRAYDRRRRQRRKSR